MTKSKCLKIVCWLLSFWTAAAAVQGALVNPGFDKPGDSFYGWHLENTSFQFYRAKENAQLAGTVTESFAQSGDMYTSPAGGSFLELKAGAENTWVTVSQVVNLKPGESLSGYAAFSGWGEPFLSTKFNDQAGVWVLSPGKTLADIATTPSCWFESAKLLGSLQGNSPWTAWDFKAEAEGDYTLVFGVENVSSLSQGAASDGKYASHGLFTAVPEPSTWVGGVSAGLIMLCYSWRLHKSKTHV